MIMDEILELLAHTGPEYTGGMTNHGPMAAEALCFLGREDAAIEWVKHYKKRLVEHHVSAQKIPLADWQEYLGKRNYFDGWKNLFDHETKSLSWESALKKWLPKLMPGIVSAAAHGVLRTAHAVRSLEAQSTPRRINELCSGLAYWASTYQTLPQKAYNGPKLKASAAIKIVKLIPLNQREYHDQISDGLTLLNSWTAFPPVIEMLDTSETYSECLDDILETFVRSYISNADTALFSALHAVTGPATLQILAGHLEEKDKIASLKYAWQASAALHIATDINAPVEQYKTTKRIKNRAELIDDAIRSNDEHAIKFTEVCLRLIKRSNDPIFNFAAQDATVRLAEYATNNSI